MEHSEPRVDWNEWDGRVILEVNMSNTAEVAVDESIERAIRKALANAPNGLLMSELINSLVSEFSETAIRLTVWHLIAMGHVQLESDRRFVKAA